MAVADGKIDEFEENTVWRVAELLAVPNRERVLLRQRVTGEAEEGVSAASAAPGPWSPKTAS